VHRATSRDATAVSRPDAVVAWLPNAERATVAGQTRDVDPALAPLLVAFVAG
jgi:hypothetical protein